MNRDDETQEQLDYAGVIEQLDKFNRLLAELPKLSSHIDEKTLIRNIIKNAKELVNADHVHVRVIDWLEKKLVLEEYTGEDENIGLKHPQFSSINVIEAIGGRVFNNKKPETINDIRNDDDFGNYLQKIINIYKNNKDVGDVEKLKKLIDVLKSIERAIVVPLYIERKSIGVLTAWRRKPSSPFAENDMIVLEHFANQASVALRNAWLFKASTWQPSESESFTVETLCQEVVNEAIKRTGAMDGRVRFVNWEKEYLVPGALVWSYINRFSWDEVPGKDTERFKELLTKKLDVDWLQTAEIKKNGGGKTIKVIAKKNSLSLELNDEKTKVNLRINDGRTDEFIVKNEKGKLNIYISERDPRVSIRKIGICPAGVVAKEHKSLMVNDLKKNPYFKDFRNLTLIYDKLYWEQLEILQEYQKCVEDNRKCPFKTKLHNFTERCEICKNLSGEAKKELDKRLNVELNRLSLLKLLYDPATSADSIKKHLNAVEILAHAWREYIDKDLEKWNSEVAVPILIGNKLIGVLNVHSDEIDRFTESDQAILQALASRVATSIMVHQQKILNRIYEIEQKMMADYSLEVVASVVAKGIREVAFLVGSEKLPVIFPLLYICKNPMPPQELIDDKHDFGDLLEAQKRDSASGDEQELLKVPIRKEGLGYNAINELARNPSESVFIVRENVDDPISGGSESAQQHGVITTACLPLAFGGIVYGLLYIHIKRRHFFTELEKDAITLFAAHAAIVVKNLKRFSEEKTYDYLCGSQLIEDCIIIKKRKKSALTRGRSK